MSTDPTSVVVQSIVSRVLEITPEESRMARRGDTEKWDSLKHIEIVFQVEEEFDVRFEEEQIAQLVDIDSITAVIAGIRGS